MRSNHRRANALGDLLPRFIPKLSYDDNTHVFIAIFNVKKPTTITVVKDDEKAILGIHTSVLIRFYENIKIASIHITKINPS